MTYETSFYNRKALNGSSVIYFLLLCPLLDFFILINQNNLQGILFKICLPPRLGHNTMSNRKIPISGIPL